MFLKSGAKWMGNSPRQIGEINLVIHKIRVFAEAV